MWTNKTLKWHCQLTRRLSTRYGRHRLLRLTLFMTWAFMDRENWCRHRHLCQHRLECRLTSRDTTSLSVAFICVVVDPFPFEIECMCSDFTCAASVACIATSVFQCFVSTSVGFPALLSMSWFSLQRVLMKTFVIIGRIHFSHTLSQCPHISQSICQTRTSHPYNVPCQHYTHVAMRIH